MLKSFVLGGIVTVATLASVSSAFATNAVSGSLWLVSAAVAADATPANVPGTAPNVTFNAPSEPLNFASGPLYTIGEFLSSGGATHIVYNGPAPGTTFLNPPFSL